MKYQVPLYFFILILCLSSCQSRMICPAFQSSFIYNDSTRAALFAYFDEDSLPVQEVYTTKTRYGIIEKIKRKKRSNQMRIVKMEKVFPEKDPTYDSLMMALNASAETGNLNLDSLMEAESSLLFHYNVEQENYLRLFGEYLPKPKPPKSEEEVNADTNPESEEVEAVEEESLSRKERRRAKREAKEKAKEEDTQDETDDQAPE